MAFGMTFPPVSPWGPDATHAPPRGITDLIAFSAALVTARTRGVHRHPGIPHILDALLRDATLYLLLVTGFQVMFMFFGLFAPVSDT